MHLRETRAGLLRDLRARRVPKKGFPESRESGTTRTDTDAHVGYIAPGNVAISGNIVGRICRVARNHEIEVGRAGRYPARARMHYSGIYTHTQVHVYIHVHLRVYCPSIFRTLSNSSDFSRFRRTTRVRSIEYISPKDVISYYFREAIFQDDKSVSRFQREPRSSRVLSAKFTQNRYKKRHGSRL